MANHAPDSVDELDPSVVTHFRTCPLCEAGCGLAIETKGNVVFRIRGDKDDVFSKGFLCPKGSSLKQLHEDPDRLRGPLIRKDGVLTPVSWSEAWAAVEAGLMGSIERNGRAATAIYSGNPNAHNLGAMTFSGAMIAPLGTRLRFSASTVDQMPKHVASGYLFGSPVAVPVPDLDRTDFLLMLGANPYASNGSLCTAPDFPGRMEAILQRGGKVVVVDPRRSRTAEAASQHVAIMPGTDALFLAAIINTIDAAGQIDLGTVAEFTAGLEEILSALRDFTPEAVAQATGVDATVIRQIATDLMAAPTAAVYGRIGTTVQAFGTLSSYLIDVLNIVSGNLDSPGGAMFAMPAAGGGTTRGKPGVGRGFRVGQRTSRVSNYPEVMGEYPVAALPEEIEADGEGQIKALITLAGNPVLSTVNSHRLDAALAKLEFMVSIDIYVNETTRHADVILPPPSNLSRSHYDLLLLQFAVRNVANYSPAVFPLSDDEPDEWEILSRVGLIAAGLGSQAAADPIAVQAMADDNGIDNLVRKAVIDEFSTIYGRDADEILASLAHRKGPERLLDFQLRSGPYGDAFGTKDDGLTLQKLIDNPHGIDLGALAPRVPGVLRTASGMIELAHPAILADLGRLRARMDDSAQDSDHLLLVGRRDLRSNNSWMHNLPVLTKGRVRCTLQINPIDADRLGVVHGTTARVASRVGELEIVSEVTDIVRPGVVSIPHGYGHALDGVGHVHAAQYNGVNTNILTDELLMDPLSATTVLNGIPVLVTSVA